MGEVKNAENVVYSQQDNDFLAKVIVLANERGWNIPYTLLYLANISTEE